MIILAHNIANAFEGVASCIGPPCKTVSRNARNGSRTESVAARGFWLIFGASQNGVSRHLHVDR